MSKDNIVLLPATAAELELEIASLMQKKDFEAALVKLKWLLTYEHQSYSVYRDTLTCLIKLCYTEEALLICEELLLDTESEHYYDYFEFYIVLLYETESYRDLIDMVEREQETMPEAYAARTNDFQVLAEQMRAWQSEEALTSLEKAIKEKDARKQYRLLFKWKNEKFPVPELFGQLLSKSDIHPVVKTEILMLLQESERQASIEMRKFDKSLFVSPSSMVTLKQHSSYLASLNSIEEMEQHDPVLYMHTKELIDHHAYVLYPFLYKEEEAADIATSALAIAKANLGLEEATLNDDAVKTILVCQELYQQIILQ